MRGRLDFSKRPQFRPPEQLELDHYTRRNPGIVLAGSKHARVDPIPLENAPVKRPDDLGINAAPDRDRERRIRRIESYNSRRVQHFRERAADVRAADQYMPEWRHARRPRHLWPEQKKGRVSVVAVVARKIRQRAQPGCQLVLPGNFPTVLIE